jgi:hypothetical protein
VTENFGKVLGRKKILIILSGVHVMTTIFGNFSNFRRKKMAIFLEANFMLTFSCIIGFIFSQKHLYYHNTIVTFIIVSQHVSTTVSSANHSYHSVQQEQSNFTIMYRASSNHKSAVNSRG